MAGMGQRIYREWLSRIRQDAREMGVWQAEVIQTRGDLDYHYQQFYDDLNSELENENSPNIALWMGRAEGEILSITERLTKKFNIPDSQGQDPNEKEEEGEEDSGTYADGTILGFRIVTPSYKRTIIALGGKRKAQVFPTLSDLQQYLDGIPRAAIMGIEEHVVNGVVRGFYLWVGDTI